MLLVVGGAARSGKTLLARSLLRAAQIPWFSLDVLRAGLTNGAPSLGLAFSHDDLEEADRVWPIVSAMIEAMLADQTDYLIEGSCLRPLALAGLMSRRARVSVRSVFLGFPDVSPALKRREIDAHPTGGNDWFSALSDTDKVSHVDRLIRDSRRLREECLAAGLPFVDTAGDFSGAQARAQRILLG